MGVYHSLISMGQESKGGSRVYGHPAPVYRATSEVDGSVYILRRIEGGFVVEHRDISLTTGFKLVNEQAFGAIDTWRRMKHPNIVGLREAFTTKAFNDNCTRASRASLPSLFQADPQPSYWSTTTTQTRPQY